jgi:hypothetical protein
MISSGRNVDIVGLLDCTRGDWSFFSIVNSDLAFLLIVTLYQPPLLTLHSCLVLTFSYIMVALQWNTLLTS